MQVPPSATSRRNSSSVTRPRLSVPSRLTAASSARCASSASSSPSSSHLIRIESMPLFLPSTIPRVGADELRRVRLDRRRVVELARDRAALAPEEVLADERLPRLERVAGQLADAVGERAHAVEVERRLDAVERAQRERDLAEVRVAGALAHAVDRAVDPRARRRGRRRPRSRSRARSRCGRGSGSGPPGRAGRACGRRGRRPPRASATPSVSTTTTSRAPASTAAA